jgi:phage terminase small subunit
MKGRKPKLFAVASREGTLKGKRKSPPLPVGDFDPPHPLGEIASSEWSRVRAEAPWISAASAGLLWMRCAKFQDMMEARADIVARGKLIETRNGSVRNPSLQIERESAAFIIRADVELGLTSCSEQKVSAPRQGASIDALEEAIG